MHVLFTLRITAIPSHSVAIYLERYKLVRESRKRFAIGLEPYIALLTSFPISLDPRNNSHEDATGLPEQGIRIDYQQTTPAYLAPPLAFRLKHQSFLETPRFPAPHDEQPY